MDNISRICFYVDEYEIDFIAPYYLLIKAMLDNIRPQVRKFIAGIASHHENINYVVDVGACVGNWAVPYSFIFPEAEILAIEPSSVNYHCLVHNLKGRPGIKTLKMVAGSEHKTYKLASPTKEQRRDIDAGVNTGLISIYGLGDEFYEEVEGKPLDDIVTKRVGWLKIDVEGAECDVLEGAKRIMSEDRPFLQIEVRKENQKMAGRSNKELWEKICKYNYVNIKLCGADWVCVPQEAYDKIRGLR